ncbi:hypothetical protein Mapa_011783 [Marchantia paleacea]|nr:hypothetical protein Mapa_011783 [Marchantia paleacea]
MTKPLPGAAASTLLIHNTRRVHHSQLMISVELHVSLGCVLLPRLVSWTPPPMDSGPAAVSLFPFPSHPFQAIRVRFARHADPCSLPGDQTMPGPNYILDRPACVGYDELVHSPHAPGSYAMQHDMVDIHILVSRRWETGRHDGRISINSVLVAKHSIYRG